MSSEQPVWLSNQQSTNELHVNATISVALTGEPPPWRGGCRVFIKLQRLHGNISNILPPPEASSAPTNKRGFSLQQLTLVLLHKLSAEMRSRTLDGRENGTDDVMNQTPKDTFLPWCFLSHPLRIWILASVGFLKKKKKYRNKNNISGKRCNMFASSAVPECLQSAERARQIPKAFLNHSFFLPVLSRCGSQNQSKDGRNHFCNHFWQSSHSFLLGLFGKYRL